jgi:hypothetical protein
MSEADCIVVCSDMPELDKSPAAGETIVEGIRIAPTKKALSTNDLAIRHSPALYPTAWPENSPGQQEKDSLRLDSPLEQGYMFPIDDVSWDPGSFLALLTFVA